MQTYYPGSQTTAHRKRRRNRKKWRENANFSQLERTIQRWNMFGRIKSIYIIGKMLHWAEELNESLVWWMAFFKHNFNATIIHHMKASCIALLLCYRIRSLKVNAALHTHTHTKVLFCYSRTMANVWIKSSLSREEKNVEFQFLCDVLGKRSIFF